MNRTRMRGSRVKRGLVFLACWGLLLGSGCSGELDPREPEGAYELFTQAFLQGDAETVWEMSDKRTQDFYQIGYDRLQGMNVTIERYLPAADHRLARKQAGTVLLDEVKDGKELFLRVFRPGELPEDEAFKVGLMVEEITVNEEKTEAKVVTRGGQEFLLSRVEGDETPWKVMLLDSSPEVRTSLKWLKDNESALRQTVDDLIDEEREKRETVIAELMKL